MADVDNLLSLEVVNNPPTLRALVHLEQHSMRRMVYYWGHLVYSARQHRHTNVCLAHLTTACRRGDIRVTVSLSRFHSPQFCLSRASCAIVAYCSANIVEGVLCNHARE
jgi:hypothetical protein